jgi:hypothetical protein
MVTPKRGLRWAMLPTSEIFRTGPLIISVHTMRDSTMLSVPLSTECSAWGQRNVGRTVLVMPSCLRQDRYPQFIQRPPPLESAEWGPPHSVHSASSDSLREPMRPPTGRPTSRDYSRGPAPHPTPYSPYLGGQPALLPPNPHAVSPYDFAYGPHPGYHASTRPQTGPYDPYYGPRAMYHPGQYPNSGVGLGRSQRQLISCYPCRGRKLKCDGQKPCAQCLRRGNEAECAYASHVRRRGKGKKAGDGDVSSEDSASGGAKTDRREGSRDSAGRPWDGDPGAQSREDADGRSSRSDSELVEMAGENGSPGSRTPNGKREAVEGTE